MLHPKKQNKKDPINIGSFLEITSHFKRDYSLFAVSSDKKNQVSSTESGLRETESIP